MTTRPRVLVWILLILPPALALVSVLVHWSPASGPAEDPYIMTALAFYVAGVLLLWKAPNNPISRLVMLLPLFVAVGVLAGAIADALGSQGTTAAWADTAQAVATTLAIMPLPVIILYFPSGRLATPRWRWLVVLTVVAASLGLVAALLNGGWGGQPEPGVMDSPLKASTAPLGDTVANLFFVFTALSFASAGATVIWRYRRARGQERDQIKWIALAAALLAVIIGTANTDLARSELMWLDWVVAFGLASLPASIAIAILRYRLYDIDRIISRTLSYGLLTALLAGLYLGTIFVLGQVFPLESDLAVAGSTLLAAAFFNPLRIRVQSAVDRRFNRSRFDAERTMDALSRRLALEVNLDQLGRELSRIASETMQPRAVAVWLR